MTDPKVRIYELSNGEIDVWIDPSGSICLQNRNVFNDPVELSESDALALAELLTKLVNNMKNLNC